MNGHVFRNAHMNAHMVTTSNQPVRDDLLVLGLRALEPDVVRAFGQRLLEDADEAAVALPDERVGVVAGEDEDVDGRGVVGHADAVLRGSNPYNKGHFMGGLRVNIIVNHIKHH